MKNKKYILSLIVIAISLVFGLVLSNALSSKHKIQAQEVKATITDNIFQSVQMVIPSESNKVLPQEDSFENDTEVKISMNFKFTNKNYKTGDTFVTTLPQGLTYTGVFEGNLAATAKYQIDSETRELTITMIADVQSAEYTIDLTTHIRFDSTLNSKQQLLFDTEIPFTYTLHLYENVSIPTKFGKVYDAEGNVTTLMPKSGGDFDPMNVNSKHADLSKSTLTVNMPRSVSPIGWSNGSVTINSDSHDFKFYTYETAINGEQIGEKKELKIGEDFTIVDTDAPVFTLKFTDRFHEALEVSGGKATFDYKNFNPNSNGKSGNTSYDVIFYISDGKTTKTTAGTFSARFSVVELGYLGFGKIVYDGNVKDGERIVATPVYINGTNQQLKKGDAFTLTTRDNPALIAVGTDLNKEYKVTVNTNGKIVEGDKAPISNWSITSHSFGEITLTYLGEDTIESFGLDLYVGMDDSVLSLYNRKFTLSGNGYSTEGGATFRGQNNNLKAGSYNSDKSVITWTATVNSLYQKVLKLTDTYLFGVKASSLKNMQISSVEFGKSAPTKKLIEGTDYEIVDNKNSFEIKFLKEVKEKLTLSYETEMDPLTVDTFYRAKNRITPQLQYASSDEKEFPVEAYAYVPDYVITNSPFLLSKNTATSLSEKIGDQPVNQVKLLINPGDTALTNNEVVVEYKTLDVEIVKENFTVNKVGQFSANSYSALVAGTEITANDDDYPEIIVEENQIRVKNKNLTQPIIVSFTFGKRNYYNVASDYVSLSQTNDGSEKVTGVSSLYFKDSLVSDFNIATSPTHPNIAEGTLTVNKNNGFALIKGTSITLGSFIPSNESKEIPSLRSVTDSDGNPLPASSISVTGGGYKSYNVEINDDQLTNGLIVKLSWTFNTSGQKKYQQGGLAYHPFVNYNGDSRSASYRSYNWSGTFTIDNSGSGGEGALIFSNMTINMVDSVTNNPVAGATYEILNNDGQVVDTITADSKGQIILKDYVVTDYTFREIQAPAGYLSNVEYSDPGQKITLSSTGENKLTIPYVKEGKIMVHFSYQDGTDIETISPITISGGNGAKINLKEQKEVKDQLAKLNAESADYHFLSFDQGAITGSEEAAVIPYDSGSVYYKYEGLISLKVPELLNFETGFVSPFTQVLSYANSDDFEVAFRDSRQITTSSTTKQGKTRGNIRLNAFLSKEFTTQENKVLKNVQLIYQTDERSIVLNGSGGELVTNKQDVANPTQKDFNYILDTAKSKTNGFKLEVPAKGTLAKEYTGEVTWELIQEP